MTKKNSPKVNFKDRVGILNAVASAAAVFTLFWRIFTEPTLGGVALTGPYLVAFIICAYHARAKFLGYKFSDQINAFMIGMPIAVLLFSIWGFISIL
jgi:hypothetical protein